MAKLSASMPDEPKMPPPPDALQKPQPAAAPPRRRTLPRTIAPLDAEPPPQPRPPAETGESADEKKKEKQASGLGEMDSAHIFAGVLATGFFRPVAILITCFLAFGFTNACHPMSKIFDGW